MQLHLLCKCILHPEIKILSV
uniref:Uncharacterized protein n=1 Tax=Anguilla anguilla TaxID=7936 RepID=A0A0E9XLK6_ANGAN